MRFNKLLIVGLSERKDSVKCRCDCGKECDKILANMKRNTAKSCGCLSGEQHRKTTNPYWAPTYKSWSHMKGRCRNTNEKFFHNYGGRGIKVCDRWLKSFEAFISDMGRRPKGCTLDRIDNNGMYCPENCRWATKLEQDNNRRRTVKVSVNGNIMSYTQACRFLGFSCWKQYHYIRTKQKTHQQSIDEFIQSMDKAE